MSALSYGSVRRLNIFGRRRSVNGSAHTSQGAGAALLHEHELPVVEPQRGEVAVVGDVEEVLARALVGLAGDVGQLVVPVEVHLVGGAAEVGARRAACSAMSGTPAAASSVTNQSLWLTMPLSTVPAGMWPGQRTIAGTR